MTENRILEALKEFIKSITANEKLKSPDKDEFVPPIVVVGYLPPKNYLPEGYDVPCIIVGMDEGEDDGEEAKINVRLSFATYDPGENNDQGQLVPDMKGYIDLLHIMTKIRIALLQTRVINGTTVIETPIKWGMYQEQPWPQWYGWMTFDARCAVQRIIEQYRDIQIDGSVVHMEIPAQGII